MERVGVQTGTQPCCKRQPKETQEEDSGKETEDSEIKERINRRKAADKEKRNKKNSYDKSQFLDSCHASLL